jgi:uncharacterized protein YycO
MHVALPARMNVDCFRHWSKFGIYVAAESVLEAVRSGSATVREITLAAVACRTHMVLDSDFEVLAP